MIYKWTQQSIGNTSKYYHSIKKDISTFAIGRVVHYILAFTLQTLNKCEIAPIYKINKMKKIFKIFILNIQSCPRLIDLYYSFYIPLNTIPLNHL